MSKQEILSSFPIRFLFLFSTLLFLLFHHHPFPFVFSFQTFQSDAALMQSGRSLDAVIPRAFPVQSW